MFTNEDWLGDRCQKNIARKEEKNTQGGKINTSIDQKYKIEKTELATFHPPLQKRQKSVFYICHEISLEAELTTVELITKMLEVL